MRISGNSDVLIYTEYYHYLCSDCTRASSLILPSDAKMYTISEFLVGVQAERSRRPNIAARSRSKYEGMSDIGVISV